MLSGTHAGGRLATVTRRRSRRAVPAPKASILPLGAAVPERARTGKGLSPRSISLIGGATGAVATLLSGAARLPALSAVGVGLLVVVAGLAVLTTAQRAAANPEERVLWSPLRLCAALAGLSCSVSAGLVAGGASDVTVIIPPAVAAVLGYPLAYAGIIRWNQVAAAGSKPHEALNGLAALLNGTAVVEIAAPLEIDGWQFHVLAVAAASGGVLVASAVASAAMSGTVRDVRGWLLLPFFLAVPAASSATLLAGTPPAWMTAVVAVGIVLLGLAAALRPAALVPVWVGATPAIIGGFAAIVFAVGLVTTASVVALPTTITWLAAGAVLVAATGTVIDARDLAGLALARREALTDELTGLPNRRAVLSRLGSHTTSGGAAVVALMDLDGFKGVNDQLGHAAGDLLLQAVAGRVQGALRPGDLLGRLGGDEFAVVAQVGAAETPAERADQLGTAVLAALSGPFDLRSAHVRVGASVGLTVAPAPDGLSHPVSVGRLLHEADVAMYEAKRTHRGAQVFAGAAREG